VTRERKVGRVKVKKGQGKEFGKGDDRTRQENELRTRER